MTTINFGKHALENDVDFKSIPDGFGIFPSAVEKHGIKPSDIDTVDGHPARADWGMLGSIMVAETELTSYGTGMETLYSGLEAHAEESEQCWTAWALCNVDRATKPAMMAAINVQGYQITGVEYVAYR